MKHKALFVSLLFAISIASKAVAKDCSDDLADSREASLTSLGYSRKVAKQLLVLQPELSKKILQLSLYKQKEHEYGTEAKNREAFAPRSADEPYFNSRNPFPLTVYLGMALPDIESFNNKYSANLMTLKSDWGLTFVYPQIGNARASALRKRTEADRPKDTVMLIVELQMPKQLLNLKVGLDEDPYIRNCDVPDLTPFINRVGILDTPFPSLRPIRWLGEMPAQ